MTELEAGKSRPPPGLAVRLPILLTQQLSLPYWHHPLPWAPPRCQAITARPCTGLEQCGPAHSRHALWLLEGLLGHLFHGRWLMRFQRGQGQPGLWCWELFLAKLSAEVLAWWHITQQDSFEWLRICCIPHVMSQQCESYTSLRHQKTRLSPPGGLGPSPAGPAVPPQFWAPRPLCQNTPGPIPPV